MYWEPPAFKRGEQSDGTYTTDIRMQHHDYVQLLKIMVMIIIKMNEELTLRSEMNMK